MSQLIKLREQIKTIKTIQKITQAMRLVSMSIHSRLNNQKSYLKNYQNELNKIANIIELNKKDNLKKPNFTPKKLIILIGSQKGLCGSFSQDVVRKFSKYNESQSYDSLMVIGKKIIDAMQDKWQIDNRIIKFTPATILETTNHIFNYITLQKNFGEVICISNSSKNFFTHITKNTTLLPIHTNNYESQTNITENYIWEQPLEELTDQLISSQLKLNIYCLLFESLTAEYAARFRSMDNATRNANDLLETSERQYRKIRQTKITRELVELSAIFQTK